MANIVKQALLKATTCARKFHVCAGFIIRHIHFLSVAVQGRNFASHAFANEHKSYRKKQEHKSFFYALLSPRFASWWFDLLKSPDFIFITKYRPRLYFKPFRVYISIRWTKWQKVKVILDTYRFILKHQAFVPVITDKHIEIARIQLQEDMEGLLALGYDTRYRKEGELVLSFECEQLGGSIASVAFSFEEIAIDQWVCWVGCIQGHKKNDLYAAKTAQKLLHGLRPKSLVVFAVQEFVRELGFSAIYGTSDSIQAYRRKHLIHIPMFHKIPFDYDTFWEESGGTLVKDGWYELPLKLVRRDIHEIKTSRRALHLRRYALMDDLSLKIAEATRRLIS